MNRVKRFFVEKAHQFFTEWVSFEQWLMSKPLDEIIGYSGSACNCPLAIFSKHLGFPVAELTCGHLDILVEGKTITPFGTGKDGNAQDGVLDTEEALWWWDFINLPLPEGEGISAALRHDRSESNQAPNLRAGIRQPHCF